jgi:hypothetical protein
MKMNRFLIAAAIFAAAVVPAAARAKTVKLPATILGAWCFVDEQAINDNTTRYERGDCHSFVLESDTLEYHDNICDLVKINVKSNVYTVLYSCLSRKDQPYRMIVDMWLDKDERLVAVTKQVR